MPCSVGQCGLQSPGTDEASGAEDEVGSALLVIIEIQFVQARYHPAFAAAHERHSDCEAFFSNAEVFTSANVRCNPRTVNNVLAGQTGDIGARSANVFAIDHGDTLLLPSKSPCSDCRSRAAAQDHKIEFFRFAALRRLRRRNIFRAVHMSFRFLYAVNYEFRISQCGDGEAMSTPVAQV